MKLRILLTVFALSIAARAKVIPLARNPDRKAFNVLISETNYKNRKRILKVTGDGDTCATPRLVLLDNTHFHNGTIEIEMAGQAAEDAPPGSSGMMGVAFRIGEDPEVFECIYFSPENGRSEDQLRRNQAVQYISHPDFPAKKMRRDAPGRYESYVDLQVGEWTRVKIEVRDSTAKLYVNNSNQPTLIINDLKLGPDAAGRIGLWIGEDTEAYFASMRVKED